MMTERWMKSKCFSFTEAKERRRELIGISTPFSYQDHSIEASYNLTKPEKYIFNAVFTENIYNSPHGDYGQLIKETEQKDLYNYTRSEYNYHSPSLDLYYEKVFASRPVSCLKCGRDLYRL